MLMRVLCFDLINECLILSGLLVVNIRLQLANLMALLYLPCWSRMIIEPVDHHLTEPDEQPVVTLIVLDADQEPQVLVARRQIRNRSSQTREAER
jgi:hypothetical protein